jgi:hypothetical protein
MDEIGDLPRHFSPAAARAGKSHERVVISPRERLMSAS